MFVRENWLKCLVWNTVVFLYLQCRSDRWFPIRGVRKTAGPSSAPLERLLILNIFSQREPRLLTNFCQCMQLCQTVRWCSISVIRKSTNSASALCQRACLIHVKIQIIPKICKEIKIQFRVQWDQKEHIVAKAVTKKLSLYFPFNPYCLQGFLGLY